MKAKLTKLTAALLLAGLAGGAQAAIDRVDTGNGELFFSVWDPTRNTSYTLDLGLNVTDVTLAGVAAQQGVIYSFSADALLQTFLADTITASSNSNLNNLIWNIGGGDSTGTGINLKKLLVTTNNTEAQIEVNSTTQLSTALGGQNSIQTALNAIANHTTLTDGSSIATLGGDPNDDQAYAGQATWGTAAGGLSGVVSTNLVGQSTNFWFIGSNATAAGKVLAVQYMGALGAAMWTFASNGTLTFAAPVPEAETWALLGLGLLGLGFYARRRVGANAGGLPALA